METLGFEITSEHIASLLGYAGLLFADLSNLILLIVGVALGVMVISAIISAIRG